jgi:hypothetical protein
MTSLELEFNAPSQSLVDFVSDKSLTQAYYDWQLSNLLNYRDTRGNIFYDKSVLLQDIEKLSKEGQIIGELLGYLGSERHHSAKLNSVDFVISRSFDFPITDGYEDLWRNFHKPSYVPPTLLTYADFINQLEYLFKRGDGNTYALTRLSVLKELLGL